LLLNYRNSLSLSLATKIITALYWAYPPSSPGGLLAGSQAAYQNLAKTTRASAFTVNAIFPEYYLDSHFIKTKKNPSPLVNSTPNHCTHYSPHDSYMQHSIPITQHSLPFLFWITIHHNFTLNGNSNSHSQYDYYGILQSHRYRHIGKGQHIKKYTKMQPNSDNTHASPGCFVSSPGSSW